MNELKAKFEIKVNYKGVNENGTPVLLKRLFLIQAISFTDAEAIITEQMQQISNDFFIEAITRSKIEEVFFSPEEYEDWYKVKVVFTLIDDKNGRENKSISYFLIDDESTKSADENIQKILNENILTDYTIESVQLTKITDVLIDK